MACQGCKDKEAEITNLLHKLIAWEADYVHKDKLQAARLEAARRVRDWFYLRYKFDPPLISPYLDNDAALTRIIGEGEK